MQLQELIKLTDNLFYANSSSYKVIMSKQKELLAIIKPTTDIKKIDYKAVEKYLNALKAKNNSDATINSKLAYLSKILNYAYKINLIDARPYIPTLKEKPSKEKYLSQAEKVQMILWCRKNKQKELLKVLLIGLYTGLRINNILSLTDANFRDGKLFIYDKKVNRNLILPVSNKIKYIITRHKSFTLSYAQCYYIFNLMKQQLQLDAAITIHTLRHTFCSDLVQKGIAIPVIQKLANHKKISTTLRYAHLNDAQLLDAVNIL